MRIIPIAQEELAHIVGVSTGDRAPGLHASDIYGDLAQDLEPKRFTGGTPDPVRLEFGLALETVLEKGLKERWGAVRPEPQIIEGVHFSPDLIMEAPVRRLGEIKLTWMSSKEVPRTEATSFPPKFRKYFWQMMFYCYGIDTPEARLITYFVNGTGRAPELLAWDITFTAQELRENYQMLMHHLNSKPYLLEKLA